MRRWKLLVIVVVICSMLCLGGSCAVLDQLKEDPETTTKEIADKAKPVVEVIEKFIPEPYTSLPRLILYGLIAAGGIWGAWNEAKGNKLEKTIVATFRGVDEYKETASGEEVLKLIGALSSRHDEANVREMVRTIRKKDAAES